MSTSEYLQQPPLCMICAEIFRHRNFDPPDQDIGGYCTWQGNYHATAKSMEDALAAGCELCILLRKEGVHMQLQELSAKLSCNSTYAWTPDQELHVRVETAETWFSCYMTVTSLSPDAQSDFGFPVWRVIQPLADSTDWMHVDKSCVNTWLHQCESKHKIFAVRSATHGDYVPPRLLQLDGTHMYLVEYTTDRRHESVRYASLSYCWGPEPKHLMLTDETHPLLTKGIPFTELPLTFTEASRLTLSLGLKYLWIDALCIRQSGLGSEADWQRHVRLMAEIYSNCTINLSASSSVDAFGGLGLHKIKARRFPVYRIRNNEKQAQGIALVPSSVQRDANLHILSRGWCFQERRLSHRVLDLYDGHIIWSCGSHMASLDVPTGVKIVEGDGPLTYMMNRSPRTGWRKDAVYTVWQSMVEDFNARNLTHANDIFPAVAGVARQISKILRDDAYIAGCWRGDLVQNILWRALVVGALRKANDGDYIAPSWSWASFKGNVEFLNKNKRDEFHQYAEILDTNLDLIDASNTFGQVRFASLRIRAPAFEMENQPIAWNEPCTVSGLHVPVYIFSDTDSALLLRKKAFIMVLGVLTERRLNPSERVEMNYHLQGLVLRFVGEESYERLGSFQSVVFPDVTFEEFEPHMRDLLLI